MLLRFLLLLSILSGGFANKAQRWITEGKLIDGAPSARRGYGIGTEDALYVVGGFSTDGETLEYLAARAE